MALLTPQQKQAELVRKFNAASDAKAKEALKSRIQAQGQKYGLGVSVSKGNASMNTPKTTTATKKPQTNIGTASYYNPATQKDELYNGNNAPMGEYEATVNNLPQPGLVIPEFIPMSYEDATKQASDRLNPQYSEALKNTLNSIKAQTMANGLFGQLPTQQLSNDEAARIETMKQGDIAQMAQALQANDKQRESELYNRALDKYNMSYQQYNDTLNRLRDTTQDRLKQSELDRDYKYKYDALESNNDYKNENLLLKQELAMLPYQQMTANQKAQDANADKKAEQAWQIALLRAASSGGGGSKGLTPYQQLGVQNQQKEDASKRELARFKQAFAGTQNKYDVYYYLQNNMAKLSKALTPADLIELQNYALSEWNDYKKMKREG